MTEFKGFTEKSNLALTKAMEWAMAMGHTYIGSEHILLGLLEAKSGTAYYLLIKHGVSGSSLRGKMESTIGRGIATRLTVSDFTPRSNSILSFAIEKARDDNHNLAGTEYLLAGIVCSEDCYGCRFLKDSGIDTELLYQECRKSLRTRQYDPARLEKGGEKLVNLKKYGRDMTLMAAEGKIDPVFCREREISDAVQVLLRRRKNNPCFVGESGVGKTAVAEGLALKIVEGDVPPMLRDCRIFSLDIPSMIAGARYRGDFEERLKSVIGEVSSAKGIILFIDEIHGLVGAGAAEGAIDAANILKPALARGDIQVIGATTTEEYRRYIEKDSALERRFQPVTVEEPDRAAAVDILKGIRSKYEKHHNVKISDEALVSAVKLSVRYMEGRRLPDKAIDLIDEACASARIRTEGEKPSPRMEELSALKEEAVLKGDFEQARRIIAMEKAFKEKKCESKTVTVTDYDIARIASVRSKIPLSRITGGEAEAVLSLESNLKKRIIGQERAVSAVCSAIKRSQSGIGRKNRPLGTFLFAGPTGVGKTELSKALSESLFGENAAPIRFDMSEYMEKHSVSGLIGAPAGYVGYEDGGRLVEAVRRKPYSVVLFDEIEKAHPDVLNVLLQILDDGHITSADGRKVSMKNCVIIMTTNAGAGAVKSRALGFGENCGEDEPRQRELERTFRPEFLNRIDEIIIFRSLTAEDISRICRGMLDELKERVRETGYELDITEEGLRYLAETGYSEKFGARNLYRNIVRLVENPISEEILSGKAEKVIVFDKARLTACK